MAVQQIPAVSVVGWGGGGGQRLDREAPGHCSGSDACSALRSEPLPVTTKDWGLGASPGVGSGEEGESESQEL